MCDYRLSLSLKEQGPCCRPGCKCFAGSNMWGEKKTIKNWISTVWWCLNSGSGEQAGTSTWNVLDFGQFFGPDSFCHRDALTFSWRGTAHHISSKLIFYTEGGRRRRACIIKIISRTITFTHSHDRIWNFLLSFDSRLMNSHIASAMRHAAKWTLISAITTAVCRVR